jgi:hypothetical protein
MIVGPSEKQVFRWHRWFAWRPVLTQDGQRVWGQFVFRKGIASGLGLKRSVFFVYRLTPENEDVETSAD